MDIVVVVVAADIAAHPEEVPEETLTEVLVTTLAVTTAMVAVVDSAIRRGVYLKKELLLSFFIICCTRFSSRSLSSSDYRNLDEYNPSKKPRWDTARLPRFEKNFYREHPNSKLRSEVRGRWSCDLT